MPGPALRRAHIVMLDGASGGGGGQGLMDRARHLIILSV